MSWSHGVSHGACLECTEQGWEAVGVSAVWNGANWRGAGHGAFRPVGVAQELIGSLWFDAEQWWQVCVARLSEPLLHIFTVAGHRGNCHSSPSRRDGNKERGCKDRREWAEEVKECESEDKDRFTIIYSLSYFFVSPAKRKLNSKYVPCLPFQTFPSCTMILTVFNELSKASWVIKLYAWTCLVSRKGYDCFKAS